MVKKDGWILIGLGLVLAVLMIVVGDVLGGMGGTPNTSTVVSSVSITLTPVVEGTQEPDCRALGAYLVLRTFQERGKEYVEARAEPAKWKESDQVEYVGLTLSDQQSHANGYGTDRETVVTQPPLLVSPAAGSLMVTIEVQLSFGGECSFSWREEHVN